MYDFTIDQLKKMTKKIYMTHGTYNQKNLGMAKMAVHRSRVKITGNMSDEGEVVEGWRGGGGNFWLD